MVKRSAPPSKKTESASEGTPFPGTDEARKAYERGQADVKAGRSKRFKSVKELIAELNTDDD